MVVALWTFYMRIEDDNGYLNICRIHLDLKEEFRILQDPNLKQKIWFRFFYASFSPHHKQSEQDFDLEKDYVWIDPIALPFSSDPTITGKLGGLGLWFGSCYIFFSSWSHDCMQIEWIRIIFGSCCVSLYQTELESRYRISLNLSLERAYLIIWWLP